MAQTQARILFRHTFLVLVVVCTIFYVPGIYSAGQQDWSFKAPLAAIGLACVGCMFYFLGNRNSEAAHSIVPVTNDFDLAAAQDNIHRLDIHLERLRTACAQLDKKLDDANKQSPHKKLNISLHNHTRKTTEQLIAQTDKKRTQQEAVIAKYLQKKETEEKKWSAKCATLSPELQATATSMRLLCDEFPETKQMCLLLIPPK